MLRLRKISFGVGFSLLLSTALAWGGRDVDDNNFQKDVIECEEALRHLTECCPKLDRSRIACDYRASYTNGINEEGGCVDREHGGVWPALSEPESTCIREMDCETMKTTNVCLRAQNAKPHSWSDSKADPNLGKPPPPAVCP